MLIDFSCNEKERAALRKLANEWMEFASLPVMPIRKRQWKAIKDLKMEKPMILLETCMLGGYVKREELQCENPYLREIERYMVETMKHAREIPDDLVVEPYFRIPWVLHVSTYGVTLEKHSAQATDGSELAYRFPNPIKTVEDIDKLVPTERSIDRELSRKRQQFLTDIFGDILPVILGGFDWFFADGYAPWLGNVWATLTYDLFRLIGNDNLFFWVYDEPDAIHRLMTFLRDERVKHFKFYEDEGILYVNNDTYNPCPGSHGYVSDLPSKDYDGEHAKLKDCWVWTDAQEVTACSPDMFKEFFLPYLVEPSEMAGLTYFGCCDPVHDRIEYVIDAIKNLRAVSVAPWSDRNRTAEILGKKYVYSHKPNPTYLSGVNPEWDMAEKELRDTLEAAKNCNLEICFRDIYTTSGNNNRLAEWAEMANKMIDKLY